MAVKNIDETIQKLLNGYAEWCAKMLRREYERIQKRKYKADWEYKAEVNRYKEARSAYDFFMKVVKKPKDFLYSGNKFFEAKLQNGEYLYQKLLPLTYWPFDKGDKHVLVNLCDEIAHHVKFESHFNNWKGVWEYRSNCGMIDLSAEKIIEMNKSVQLWISNDFMAAIKDFVPASAFAVNSKDKER